GARVTVEIEKLIVEGMVDLLAEEDTRYLDALIDNMKLEPHEFDYMKLVQELDRMVREFQHANSKIGKDHLHETRVREDVMIAKRRLLITKIALERYRLQHDRYP